MIGPNVRRLIAVKMAKDAIPPGGGLASGIDYLLAPGLSSKAQEAARWVEQAIAVVKTAPDNPWGNDDEAIAGELLRRLESRK